MTQGLVVLLVLNAVLLVTLLSKKSKYSKLCDYYIGKYFDTEIKRVDAEFDLAMTRSYAFEIQKELEVSRLNSEFLRIERDSLRTQYAAVCNSQ